MFETDAVRLPRELFRARVTAHPDDLACTFTRDGEDGLTQVTYAELDARARAIAAELQRHQLSGRRVLLLCPAGLDYIACLIAALYEGVVVVPAYPPLGGQLARAAERIQKIAADCDAAAVLATDSVSEACSSVGALSDLTWISIERACSDQLDIWVQPELSEHAIGLLQYTSGSTGTPKGVMISQAALVAHYHLGERSLRELGRVPVVSWLPPYHDMGLIGSLLHSLFAGRTAHLMAPESFIRKPIRWLQAITRARAAITMAPNFAFDLCVRRIKDEQLHELDLSSLRVAYNGAEPINPGTLDAFAKKFAACGFAREALYPCYGMAEATLMISGNARVGRVPVVRAFSASALEERRAECRDNHEHATDSALLAVDRNGHTHAHDKTRVLVGCGAALHGERIAIVDPDSRRALPEGSVGEIWVQSPSVALGYWNRPEESANTFDARLADEGTAGPFLRSGDLGFFDAGELFVSGRLKDLIIIRGRNHYPTDVERSVQSMDPALLPDCGAAFSIEYGGAEALVVVQEVDHRLKPDLGALLAVIQRVLRDEHDLVAHAIWLIKKGSVLKTSSGKVQRRAMRQAYLDQTLPCVTRCDVTASDLTATDRATDRSETDPRQSHIAPIGAHHVRPDQTETRRLAARPTQADIAERLRTRLAERTKLAAQDIDDHAPLARYGVDSLYAAELTEELEQWLGCAVPTTISYDNPTISQLAASLARLLDKPAERGRPPSAAGRNAALRGNDPTPKLDARPRARRSTPHDAHDAIAIVGMSCRFPGANDLRGFWQLLRHGLDAIQEVPRSRFDIDDLYDSDPSKPGKISSRHGGFVEQIDRFDPQFFGISAREATRMDPQQRLFLEVAWEALEDAAIAPSSLSESDCGVFAGVCSNDYALLYGRELGLIDADYGTGNSPSVVANRLSYVLNLKGPSVTFDTACSSSLVALQSACHSLLHGDIGLAIVGGVNAVLAPEPSVFFSKARALAKDGRCKTFDARADGFVRSEGCGVIVIKRLANALADRDQIYAVVAGSAVNHDGASNGLMAPSGPSQQRLIRRALEDARIGSSELDYIEAHGVGAKLADIVELRALGELLNEEPRQGACLVGSVKTNIGHSEAASGMASLIKTALALSHEEIPAHLHLQDVHPDIGIDELPIAIPTTSVAWKRGPRARFAGVSTFGFGGTNAHVVLREAPVTRKVASDVERPRHVFAISARDRTALSQVATRMVSRVTRGEPGESSELSDLCYTANTGRTQFKHRAAFAVETRAELVQALQAFAIRSERTAASMTREAAGLQPKVAFLFTENDVPRDSGRLLYATQPVFRQAIDHARHVLEPQLEASAAASWYAGDTSEPAANGVGLSLDKPSLLGRARTLIGKPGTSSDKPNAPGRDVRMIVLQYALFRLLESWGIKPSFVLGQGAGEYAAACAAGALAWEDAFVLVAKRAQILSSLTPGAPVTLTLRQFKAALAAVKLEAPTLPFVSGSLDRAFAVGETLDQKHWLQQIYHLPGADDGVSALLRCGATIMVELGALHSKAREHGRSTPLRAWLPTLSGVGSDYQTLLDTVAQLYTTGVDIDWRAFDEPFVREKLSMPTYPFQRARYWMDFPEQRSEVPLAPAPRAISGHPLLRRAVSSTVAVNASTPAAHASHSGFVRKQPEDETG